MYLITNGGDYAKAQISSDGTLSTQLTTPDNFNFTITDGTRQGRNLFHSFREFSVPTGGSAFFNATDAITIGQSSMIQNDVAPEGTGKGGNINIQARSLSLTDESSLSTRTFGQGDAGSISLQVNDTLSGADSSSIFSYVFGEATGNGGNIDIQTHKLSLTDSSVVLASTFAAGGEVIITDKAPTVTSHSSWLRSSSCEGR